MFCSGGLNGIQDRIIPFRIAGPSFYTFLQINVSRKVNISLLSTISRAGGREGFVVTDILVAFVLLVVWVEAKYSI